jgi:hypothetical protein
MEDGTGENFLNSWTDPFTPLISGTSPCPSRFTCWEEVAFEPTLYMKLEVEQTPKGEVEKNYLVCYPIWGKKKPPVRIE